MKEWTDILDRYGWPSLFLVVVGMFFWRGLWPMILAHIKASDERSNKLVDEFLVALERRDKIAESTVTELRRLADKLK